MGAVCYMAGEIKNPKKTLPRALIATVLVVSVLYVALSFVATGLLPMDILAGSEAPIAEAASRIPFIGSAAGVITAIMAIIVIIGSLSSCIMFQPRIEYAMAENEEYQNIDFVEYLDMTKSLFEYLKGLDKEQSYWEALGSNQKVYNCEKGKFIDKAKKAYNKISSYDGSESDINSKLREIFGDKFPEVITVSKSAYELASKKTEQFISDLFPVDIQNSMNIDCEVTQDGFRPFMLRHILKNNNFLPVNKSLKFSIKECDVEGDYDIYWKVKNVGSEALRLDNIRGQINKTNSKEHKERTSFRGSHFVECYIVKNGICVAKDKIDVPIS